MRPVITIPHRLFRHTSFAWSIDWRNQTSGDFNDGVTGTSFGGFPRWIGSPGVFMHREDLRRWRAVRNTARGRIGIYRVRIVDSVGFLPSETVTQPLWLRQGKPSLEGNLTQDGNGWLYEPFALAAAPALRGATEIRLDMASVNGLAPKQGQIMSHQDWPFVVTWVRAVGGTIYRCGVEMPLRADIKPGAPVLMQGVGRFEATESGMGLDEYEGSAFSRFKLQFTEVLAR